MSKIKHQKLEALRFIKRCDRLIERLRDWEHVWPEDIDKPAGHLYEDAADRIKEMEAKLDEAQWLLNDAAVQLEDGKIKTRRNRVMLIRDFLAELRGQTEGTNQ